MEEPSEESRLGRDGQEEKSESFWQFLNPLWMWWVKPRDCVDPGGVCPGLLYMPGCMALIGFHAGTVAAFFGMVLAKGYRNVYLWSLAPLALVWIWLCGADLKFRLQGADKDQRRVFDNSVFNWIGCISLIYSLIAGTVMLIVSLISIVRRFWT